MISCSRLYGGVVHPKDELRYPVSGHSQPRGPVVVWNATARCNLHCAHCYSHSAPGNTGEDALSTREAFAMIDDLADCGCPVLLFSGGEPLVRADLPHLIDHARNRGIRPVLSTNGMLFTPRLAHVVRSAGTSYVGISIDGSAEVHDALRGEKGAHKRALRGLRMAREAGMTVGLRHTMTRENLGEIDYLFHLMDREGVSRICFYHLVPAGRGEGLTPLDYSQTRAAINQILEHTRSLAGSDTRKQVLTVDNHADGVWIYLRLLQEDPGRAAEVRALLAATGGNRSGAGIACIGWDGTVYPDQFTRNHPVGNICRQSFSDIWGGGPGSLLERLRNRTGQISGRCGMCAHFPICNGNLRARAEGATGDFWASDPGCYLTGDEICTAHSVQESRHE